MFKNNKYPRTMLLGAAIGAAALGLSLQLVPMRIWTRPKSG